MHSSARPTVIGVLCAVPVALVMGWFATLLFDPAAGGPLNSEVNRALGLGPLRGIWFAVGALVSAAIVAPRLAREDVGSLGGLVRFVGLGHLIAYSAAVLEIAVIGGGLDPSILIAWSVGLVFSLGGSLIAWLPAAAIWVGAVRRLTVEDLEPTTALERAESEQRRNAAAREHVTVDATNLADQGSKLYRNRG
jgi:hypothetical protein